MSESEKFGKIEKKSARKYWKNEASVFTPWLARNINLLGKEIGMELEVEEQESNVGSFRVDLVCKNEDEHTVIIENQLEKTNHRHLGQLLTYAAGKDAAAVVWVAIDFTDEHRAALDWLNEKTGEDISFFGVQIEVWKIGDSAAAPKFEVVCKPNQWTKVVKKSEEMNNAQKLRFDFWSGLQEYMQEKGGKIAPQPPVKWARRRFAAGSNRFGFIGAMRLKDDFLVVRLLLRGGDETKIAYYRLLLQQKNEIEKEISAKLEWREHSIRGNLALTAVLRRENCDLRDRKNWPDLYQWMHVHLEKFHSAFHHRIQNLNPDE